MNSVGPAGSLVSVIIPLYNGGRYIDVCLRSVFSQTHPSVEIFVVDDGSTDGGPGRVQSLMQTSPFPLTLLSHPDRQNMGIAASRNLGIRHARGQFIAFLDQDDLWSEEKLAKQVRQMEAAPGIGLTYARIGFVNAAGEPIMRDGYISSGKDVGGDPCRALSILLKENTIPSITVLARADAVRKVGCFDVGPRHEYEDWLLWSKLAASYSTAFLPEILAFRREHGKNYSDNRLKTGLDLRAEEHYVVTLFSYLLDKDVVRRSAVRRLLRIRAIRFLVRARSWGCSAEEIYAFAISVGSSFPSERRVLKAVAWLLQFFPAAMAAGLRRIRRRTVGM